MAKEIEEIEENPKLSSSAHNFPIVGIGASAGGLDAFKKLLEAIPVDSGMAYVVVQHLNPAHDSNLTEILSRVTKIPIEEVTDEVKIFPNHIYVMPSGKILTSVDGVLKLTPRDSVKTNLVIDIFFTSIAVVWESMAVGVVLSGTGADGTVGLKMIKEHGGITIAQDESATYGDMPQNAVNADVVDFVLPAEKIPAQLLKINNTYTAAHALIEEQPLPINDEILIKQMLQVLYQFSGVDFIHYKQNTVHRRIGRRMALHRRGNLADYLKFLQTDKTEQEQLFHDMLISVTSFFRDPKMFETLTEKVFPALLKSKPAEDAIRFWIAGCATGEEAYSIAICLHEFLGKNLSGKKIQIFASDISEIAIKKAREGIYSKDDVQTISEERLNNYFTKTGGSYQLNKDIRDCCVFATHNFLKDPPFAKMDLISCRNVLIYMDSFLQKKAFTTFHYALKENAILLLGKSETASAASELFASFDKKHKIYSRKLGAGNFMRVVTGRREETLTTQNTTANKEASQTDFRTSANEILISKSPAAVIVNDEMDIVHIHGDIDPFLKHSPGKPSLNLFKMASGGLALELRNAIHNVKSSKDAVIKEDIPVNANSKQTLVTIEIIPLTDTVDPHYLILFTETYLPATPSPLKRAGVRSIKNDEALKRIEQLERELAHTREVLLSNTEEMEAANEELQSANEELQSSNEEMQSLNEEIETTKEELQSSNEELISLNQELVDKQDHFNASRDYSEAIVSTIKEPLLVLDKSLRIKSANASFYTKFNLTQTETEGTLFYDLQKHRWNNNELRTLLENILPQKSRVDDFEMSIDERIMLLNAREITSEKKTEHLILLTIDDVTDTLLAKKLKISEALLARERQVLYNSFMNAPAGIAILKGDTHIYEFANTEYEKLVDRKITIGKTVQELFPEVEQQGIIDILNNVFSTGEPFIANEFPVELINERTGKLVLHHYNSVMQPLKDEKGNTERLLSHAVEVTQQVKARKQIEASEKRFGAAVEAIQGILWTNNAKGEMEGEQKGWAALTGQSYEEYKGYGWATAVHPDDAQPTIDAWNEAVKESKTFVFEHRVKTKTDKWEIFSIKAIPLLNEDGSIREWVGVHTNITEQKEADEKIKESEAKFRTLSETIPHLVWTATPEGKKNYFNKYFLDYTGLSFEELKGDGWQSIIFPDDLQKALQQWNHSLKTGEDFRIEKRIRKHDGTYRWHLSNSIAQKDIQGNIIGWIGSITEIEEQKKFTEDLETKVKERTEQLQLQNHTFELAESIAKFGSYKWNITTGALEYSDNLFRLLDCEPQEFVPSFEKFYLLHTPMICNRQLVTGIKQ